MSFPRFSQLFVAICPPIFPGDHPRGHGRTAARGVGRAFGERAEERLAPGAEAGARNFRGDLPGSWMNLPGVVPGTLGTWQILVVWFSGRLAKVEPPFFREVDAQRKNLVHWGLCHKS